MYDIFYDRAIGISIILRVREFNKDVNLVLKAGLIDINISCMQTSSRDSWIYTLHCHLLLGIAIYTSALDLFHQYESRRD